MYDKVLLSCDIKHVTLEFITVSPDCYRQSFSKRLFFHMLYQFVHGFSRHDNILLHTVYDYFGEKDFTK